MPLVDVEDLRVGMYVHLGLGWADHPFALSSFRIASADQIATIRSLGLRQLRWEPGRSELLPATAGPGGGASARAAATDVADPPATPDAQPTPARFAAATGNAVSPDAAAGLPGQRLAAQRAALQRCEAQYAEAAGSWREAAAAVAARPLAARDGVQALTGALVDKLLPAGDVCIQLLAANDGDTATAHALNVAVLSLLLGRTFGLSAAELLDVGVGALLHDVGKLDLPRHLRHADPSMSAAAGNAYRGHVALGVAHGGRMQLSPGALLVLAQHHENADGSGFPARLRSDRISMAARLVALANRYDNLCNPAQAWRALTPSEALALLYAQGRQKYDANVIDAFNRMMGVYPPGSLVQLSDGRHALVVSVNATRPLKPRLLVHAPGTPPDAALFVDLQQTPGVGIVRSMGPSKLPPAARAFLAPRPTLSYFFEPVVPVAVTPPLPAAMSPQTADQGAAG